MHLTRDISLRSEYCVRIQMQRGCGRRERGREGEGGASGGVMTPEESEFGSQKENRLQSSSLQLKVFLILGIPCRDLELNTLQKGLQLPQNTSKKVTNQHVISYLSNLYHIQGPDSDLLSQRTVCWTSLRAWRSHLLTSLLVDG